MTIQFSPFLPWIAIAAIGLAGLLLAALAGRGDTILRDVYVINRGYEADGTLRIVQRLFVFVLLFDELGEGLVQQGADPLTVR